MNDVVVVSASVGAGHDAAAAELARRLALRGMNVSRLDLLDLLPARLGPVLRTVYRAQLGLAGSWRALHAVGGHRSVADAASTLTTALIQDRLLVATVGARAIVSTHPLAGRALGMLRRTGELICPAVVYLTDMAVHPLWVAPGVDLHLAMHPEPARAATRLGATRVQVVTPAIAPDFHPAASHEERRATRRRHGLPDHRPLALITTGSWGIGDVDATMRDVARGDDVVPVALCGQNTRLRDRLVRRGLGIALGWTEDMDRLLAAADVVIQNAGGMTSLQALACGVPMLSYRCIGGHGVHNSRVLDRAGLATFVHDRDELTTLLAALARGHEGTTTRAARAELTTGIDPAAAIADLVAGSSRAAPAGVVPVGAPASAPR